MQTSKLLRTLLMGVAVAIGATSVLPGLAKADPPHWNNRRDHNFRPDPHWREHERQTYYWRTHHRYYYPPPHYVYAPPPVVYEPEPSPGINLIVPLHIH